MIIISLPPMCISQPPIETDEMSSHKDPFLKYMRYNLYMFATSLNNVHCVCLFMVMTSSFHQICLFLNSKISTLILILENIVSFVNLAKVCILVQKSRFGRITFTMTSSVVTNVLKMLKSFSLETALKKHMKK